MIQIPTELNLSDIGTKPLSVSRTRALLFLIGMVDVETHAAIGEAEYEEVERKREVGKRIKSMAKTLGKILAVSSLEGAQGYMFEENDKCYETEYAKAIENDMVSNDQWSLSMTWALVCICIVLAISAVMWFGFMLWKAWRDVKQRMTMIEQRYQELIQESEATQERLVATDDLARGSSILSQSLVYRIVTSERRAEALWEAIVRMRIYKQS